MKSNIQRPINRSAKYRSRSPGISDLTPSAEAVAPLSNLERGTRSQCHQSDLSRVFFSFALTMLRIQDLKTSFTSLYEIKMPTEEHTCPERADLSPMPPNRLNCGQCSPQRYRWLSNSRLQDGRRTFVGEVGHRFHVSLLSTLSAPMRMPETGHSRGLDWTGLPKGREDTCVDERDKIVIFICICTANRKCQKGGSIRFQPCLQKPNARRRIATSAMRFEPITISTAAKLDSEQSRRTHVGVRDGPTTGSLMQEKRSTQPAGIALLDVTCLEVHPQGSRQRAESVRKGDLMIEWSHSMSAFTENRIRDGMSDAKHATRSQNRALSGALGRQKNLSEVRAALQTLYPRPNAHLLWSATCAEMGRAVVELRR
ncbi:hypothetical protein HII31_12533, partial [Pseudocercospora fuligena]